jgi:hypothetical protein
VSLVNLTGNAEFSVTSTDGKLVRNGAFNAAENLSIDLSKEPSGMYLLQVTSTHGFSSTSLRKE